MTARLSVFVFWLAACGPPAAEKPQVAKKPLAPFAYPTEPGDAAPLAMPPAVLITGATVMTATGATHSPGYVLLRYGRFTAVGAGAPPAAADAKHLDGTGMFVTPVIIDTHSHMGVYPLPHAKAHSDGNEATRPTT